MGYTVDGTGAGANNNLISNNVVFGSTQAGFNVGTYNSSQMTADITATDFGTANLTAYANYAAQQLPVLYQPQAFAPGEVIKTLKSSIGFTPNPLGNFMPEYLHY